MVNKKTTAIRDEIHRETLIDRGYQGDEQEYEIIVRQKRNDFRYRRIDTIYIIGHISPAQIRQGIDFITKRDASRRGRRARKPDDALIEVMRSEFGSDQRGIIAYFKQQLDERKISRRTFFRRKRDAFTALQNIENHEQLSAPTGTGYSF